MRGVALAVVVALQAIVLVVASIKDPNKISARRVASKRGLSSFSGKITNLTLIDTETDNKVADLVNGTIIDINSAKFAATRAWSINASFFGEDIGSVRFGHNGNPNVHTENKAWYSFCGNRGNDFFNCSALSVIGNHTVTATPFSNRSAAGESGTPYTVTFAIVSSDHDNMPLSVKAKTPNVPSITPIAAPAPTGAAVKPLIPTGAVVPAPVASPSMPTDSPANRNSTASMVTTPQLLNMTVSSSAINVTSGPATVNVWIKVQDVGSQFNEFSIEAAAPGIVYQTSGRCSTSDRGMAGSTVFIGCMLRLIFAQHCPAGNYSLQLYANDENYGYHVNAAELQRRGFSHVIHVASASPDMTPPTLLDMAILSDATSVNVTDGDVEWDVQIVVQDEWGVEHGFVEAIGPDGSEAVPGYFGTYDYNTSIAAVPLIFNVSLFFVNNNAPGTYYLQVRLYDKFGNQVLYNASALQANNLPSTTEVFNAAYDGTPPVLLDLVLLSPTIINVTAGPIKIHFQLLVQDGMSGVYNVYLGASGHPSGHQMYITDEDSGESIATNYFSTSHFFKAPSLPGEAVALNVSMEISKHARGGRYRMNLELSDFDGNSVSFTAGQLANRTLPYYLDIVSDNEDIAPPQLLNLIALTSSTVNASSDDNSVTLQIVAQDNVSGIVELYLTATDDAANMLYGSNFMSFHESPVIGQPVSFNVTLMAKQSVKPGRFALTVSLGDAANNFAYYTTKKLAELNFPQYIDVVNPAHDFTPPALVDFVLLSPSSVNVTNAAATIDVQLVIQDDISGFTTGVLELWSYDDSFVYKRHRRGEEKVERINPLRREAKHRATSDSVVYNISHVMFASGQKGTDKAMVFNVSLPIPQYFKAGAYALQGSITDFADNTAYLDTFVMEEQSFPYKIQVDNEIVDNEPPTLVNLTVNPTFVNASAWKGASFELQLVVQDSLSGIDFAYVGIAGPQESTTRGRDFSSSYYYFNDSATWLDDPVAGKPAVFNFSFAFGRELDKGSYAIEVGFGDATLHQIYKRTKDLVALGFPGTVVVA